MSPRTHGGPDEQGPAAFDFSTNANACGPCPMALVALQAADPRTYPDPRYRALRERLADHHGVDASRIVPAASASEAIQRITARAVQTGVKKVSVPARAYGDYRHAAEAWGLPLVARGGQGADTLAWACDPSSPLGQADDAPATTGAAWRLLDRAYSPLRLEGADGWDASALAQVWQLWTPNKALGLTGIRAAYLIAPVEAGDEVAALDRLAPSWPIGSHGVAMLDAWCRPDTQAWLADSRDTLRGWKRTQLRLCADLGWESLPSQANFFVARLPQDRPQNRPGNPPGNRPADLLTRLRADGVQLRDCASFGLPGHVRLGVLPPAAQRALAQAVHRATTIHAPKS